MKVLSLLLAFFVVASLGAQAQEWAKERLDKSPRHQDWVSLRSGKHKFKAFIVYPEVSGKAPAVLVIHENTGLTDWAREITDEIASQGYIAIAPDMLNEKVYSSQADARKAVAELPADQITGYLDASAKYAAKLPSANGKLVVVGFCWGGGQAFRYATNNPSLKAAFVFYGPPPEAADIARINAPVYGFYGANDSRITSTVDTTAQEMKAAGKQYHYEVFADAGHGFMRAGEAPDAEPGTKAAHDKAWGEFVDYLKEATK